MSRILLAAAVLIALIAWIVVLLAPASITELAPSGSPHVTPTPAAGRPSAAGGELLATGWGPAAIVVGIVLVLAVLMIVVLRRGRTAAGPTQEIWTERQG